MLPSPFFNVSSDALSKTAEAMQSAHLRVPLLPFERKSKGYRSTDDRTLSDTLKREKWQNCRTIAKIEAKLRPSSDDEIVAFISINPIERHEEKARSIGSDILRNVNFRYWASFLEPTCNGIPHYHILIRISRRSLKKLEIYLNELSKELYKSEGFAGIIDLKLCDSESWNNHEPGHWPWPLGYSAKYSYDLNKILSFKAWLNGRRWVRESRKCIRPPADEKSEALPYGSLPGQSVPKNPTISIPAQNTANPTSSDLSQDQDNFLSQQDEQLEHEGRNLNDQIAKESRPKKNITIELATPELSFSAASILMNQKLSDREKEASLDLLRALSDAELSARAEAQKAASEKIRKQIRKRWGMLYSMVQNINKLSQSNSISAVAADLNNAVNNGDIATLKKYGLSKNADMRCDTWRVLDLSLDIKNSLQEWNGTNLKKQKEIDNNLKELRVHEHTLKFAKIYNAIDSYCERRGLYGNSEIYIKLRKQLRFHKKLTNAAYWFGIDLAKCSDARILQRLLGTDLRLNSTRAMHGRDPKIGQKFASKVSGETSSRVRTRDERNLEIACAYHEQLARAERQQHARKFLSTAP